MSKNINFNLERIMRRTEGSIEAIGSQTLTVTNGAVVHLTVPATAKWALIRFEGAVASSLTDATRIARYWCDGTVASASSGIAIGQLETLLIGEAKNLNKLSIWGLGGASTAVTAQIQYYK